MDRLDDPINIDTDYGEEQESELNEELLQKLKNAPEIPDILLNKSKSMKHEPVSKESN